jgi:endo-1,4-beta-xylanase
MSGLRRPLREHWPQRVAGRAIALGVLGRAGLLAAALAGLSACGGGDSPTTVTPPVDKTCAQDPTQAKCNTTPTGPSTLAAAATAKGGRYFGTAVDALFTAATPDPNYQTVLAREFDMLTPGNVMKWGSINRDSRTTYRWTWPDSMVAYALARGWKVHGHNLAWHQQNPTWLTSVAWNPDTLNVVLKEHIAAVVGHYKGKIFAWDVVNEGLADDGHLRMEGPWAPVLGQAYIETAFRAARAADSAAELLYNDYNLEFPGAKQDSAFLLVQGLKVKGLIDGIGFQAHFQINADGSGVPSRTSLTATFNRFAALGLKVHITELDVRVRTPGATQAELDAQSKAYGDIVAACLAVTGCESIVVWGVTDAESWIPSTFPGWGQALLFDNSYSKKATYTAVFNALTQ